MSKSKFKIFLILNVSFFLMPFFALAMNQNLIDDPFRGTISSTREPLRGGISSTRDPNHPSHNPFLRDDRSAAPPRAGACISGPEATYSAFDSLQAPALTAPHNTAASAAPHALPTIREAIPIPAAIPIRIAQPQQQPQSHPHLQLQSALPSQPLSRPPAEVTPPRPAVLIANDNPPPTAAPLLSPVPPIDASRAQQPPAVGLRVTSEEVEMRVFLCSSPPLYHTLLGYCCTYMLVDRYCDSCCNSCVNVDCSRECGKCRDCCISCGNYGCCGRCGSYGRRCAYGSADCCDYYRLNGCCRRPPLALPQANRRDGAVSMTRG